MGYIQKQGYCHHCGEMRLHTCNAYQVPHIFHLLISLLCFFWVFVWLFHVVANLGPRGVFLCTQCGQPEGILTAEEAAQRAEEAARIEGIRLDIKAAARRKRRINQAHRREMRRGRRRRRWNRVNEWRQLQRKRFDDWLTRTIGEENDLLLDLVRAFIRIAPFVALAAAAIVAWRLLT